MYKKIVVGTDLSSTAKIATDRAASLASKLGAELTLVHAGTDPGQPLDDLAEAHAVIVRTDEWLAGHPEAPRALRRQAT